MERISPILCYVTDAATLGGDAARLRSVIERAAAGGVDWIQIREKQMPTLELLQMVRHALGKARTLAEGRQDAVGTTKIIVNDRVDVALTAGADGVHLGGSAMPVADVVSWLRRERARLALAEDFLVGASCHSLEEAQQAERAGASYVIFGPVYATPSKAQYGAPQGVERLRAVCAAVRVPVLTIGGITVENAGGCFGAGASGIAAIRLFQEAADVTAVVRRLRRSVPT
jgi:thiamine-phosphate pyrophosphorylase